LAKISVFGSFVGILNHQELHGNHQYAVSTKDKNVHNFAKSLSFGPFKWTYLRRVTISLNFSQVLIGARLFPARLPPAVLAHNYPCRAHNKSEAQTQTVPYSRPRTDAAIRLSPGSRHGSVKKVEKYKKHASLQAAFHNHRLIKHS
jgi:hypothetical protein